jgi:hypothetical protein
VTGWHRYWLIWFVVSFLAFAIPEGIALFTDWRNTLSASIWDLEGLVPGQPLDKWGTAHVLIGGMLALILIWLIGHLVLGIWTGWKS